MESSVFKKYFVDILINHYADFSGRARRREFWFFTLFEFLFSLFVLAVCYVISLAIGGIVMLLALVAIALTILPSLAVTVRRLHDVGLSGWLYLLNLIPYVGPLIIIVITLLDSNPGQNQYGPNPKIGPETPTVFD